MEGPGYSMDYRRLPQILLFLAAKWPIWHPVMAHNSSYVARIACWCQWCGVVIMLMSISSLRRLIFCPFPDMNYVLSVRRPYSSFEGWLSQSQTLTYFGLFRNCPIAKCDILCQSSLRLFRLVTGIGQSFSGHHCLYCSRSMHGIHLRQPYKMCTEAPFCLRKFKTSYPQKQCKDFGVSTKP